MGVQQTTNARVRNPGAEAAGRAELFRESWNTWAQRWVLGTAYALKPNRIATVPYLLWNCAADLLQGRHCRSRSGTH